MTRPKSQSDSSPDTDVFISYRVGSRQHTDFLATLSLESSSLDSRQAANPNTPPTTRRHNGKAKRRIQDHPQWSAYLSQRRILEPAVAADAWVEHEEWRGQAVLVWRTRRRDGRPGATRRRLLKTVKTKGKKQAKVRWQYAGQKTDEPFYKPTEAVLLHYALRLCRSGPLAEGFTRDEFIKAARPLRCNLKTDTIKKFFKSDVYEDDNHPFFAKVDPGDGASIRKCKFRLRSLKDIKRRLLQGIRYRVYEDIFRAHRDTLIDFKAFDVGLPGSKYAKRLQSALEPLYQEQNQRFESLKNFCDRKIAAYEAELEDLSATPLPNWTIDQPCELPTLLARGIYDADREDRSKREWARLLGVSEPSVNTVLQRAGIQRRAFIVKKEVNSHREAREWARELGAKIIAAEVDGHHETYNTALEISQKSTMFFQPTAEHTIVSDEKQKIKAPTQSSSASVSENAPARADNMEKPGNWTKSSWDPQFIYWELVKACCLLHNYDVIDDVGIYDPQTGEVWTNPTLDELINLITGELPAAEPDPG